MGSLKKLFGKIAYISVLLLFCMVVYYAIKVGTQPTSFNIADKVFDKNSINSTLSLELDNYFNEIYKYTGIKLMPQQITLIKNYLSKNPIYLLPPETRKQNRADFDRVRKNLIKEWEANSNTIWPKYSKNVYIDGKIMRKAGQNYDAHHIIELSWNGPNEWWNLTPAEYPNQHQNGIHSKGSIASKLFDIYANDD